MAGNNLTLLSQHEIDTLVKFLNEKRQTGVSNEVLTQDSIDRLIKMIRTTSADENPKTGMRRLKEHAQMDGSKIRENQEQICELMVGVMSNGFIEIKILNRSNGNLYYITPHGTSETPVMENDNQWGRCISPFTFADIASIYDAKFTRKTYEGICRLYAAMRFGDKTYKIPDFFLPDERDLEGVIVETI